MVETLQARYPENCLKTVINTCTKLREAASFGKAIADYDKTCAGHRDYQNLTREILSEEVRGNEEAEKARDEEGPESRGVKLVENGLQPSKNGTGVLT